MMNEDQIKGHIADTESKLQALTQNHERMVGQFNQAVVQNQASFNQLNGQLSAFRAMLEKPVKEKKPKK